MSEDTMLVTLRVAELRAIVRDEIAAAEHPPAGPEPLLDLRGMCDWLSCSAASVTRMVRDGCPTMRLGVHGERRWNRASVQSWLETRGQA